MSVRTEHLWMSEPAIQGACDSCRQYRFLHEINVNKDLFYVCDLCVVD